MHVKHRATVSLRTNAFLLAAMFLLVIASGAMGEPATTQGDGEPQVLGPFKPLRSGITGDHIVAELLDHEERRSAALMEYTAAKRHQVFDSRGEMYAEEVTRINYRAPNKKTTSVLTSQSGWAPSGRFTFYQVVASEADGAATEEDRESSITPANYNFDLRGEQQVGPSHCFVVQAIPKRKDESLFAGRIWIDAQDFAIVRIEGHPAKRPSFWIAKEYSVRQYQRIDGFWLPEKDERLVYIRIYGSKIMTIDHWDYVVNHAIESESSGGAAPEPGSGTARWADPLLHLGQSEDRFANASGIGPHSTRTKACAEFLRSRGWRPGRGRPEKTGCW